MDWATVLALWLAVLAGAFVQSSIGFGMSVVSAPFVVVFEPSLVPGALIVMSFALSVAQLVHGPVDIAWRPLGWALGVRLLLTPVGVLAVALLSQRGIAIGVGLLILLTVAASTSHLDVRATPRNAAVAGGIAGVSGTAASIDGPFLGLVLQHESPQRVRTTMAAFFIVGNLMALGGLVVGHQFTREQLLAGLVWIPFVLAGYAVAAPARKHLDRGRFRAFVLAFCVVAALSIIVRAVVA